MVNAIWLFGGLGIIAIAIEIVVELVLFLYNLPERIRRNKTMKAYINTLKYFD